MRDNLGQRQQNLRFITTTESVLEQAELYRNEDQGNCYMSGDGQRNAHLQNCW